MSQILIASYRIEYLIRTRMFNIIKFNIKKYHNLEQQSEILPEIPCVIPVFTALV